MIKSDHLRNLLTLNIGMLFVSTSGMMGRYIQMSPGQTTFFRAFFAMIILLLICRISGISLKLDGGKSKRIVLLSGILLAAHWVLYFYSLQLSNVATGMLSIFTYPVLTAFLEPVILKLPFRIRHIFLALLTLAGLYFLIPQGDSTEVHWMAVPLGVLSALVYALRNILMKNQIVRHNGLSLMFWQLLAASVFLTVFIQDSMISDITLQWRGVLFLAIITTVAGHTLFLISLRNFSVTTASILSCTQPIFGIILGMLFLQEYPPITTWLGGILILVSVITESLMHNRGINKN